MKGLSVFRDEWRFFIRKDGKYYKIMSQYSDEHADRAYIAWNEFEWARCPLFRLPLDARAYMEAYINFLL